LGVDKRFHLQAKSTGLYFTGFFVTSNPIVANASDFGSLTYNEVWDVIPFGNYVAILNEATNTYWSAGAVNMEVAIDQGAVSDWEKFQIVPQGNHYSIKSNRNGGWLSLRADNTIAPLDPSVTAVTDTELFNLVTPTGGGIGSWTIATHVVPPVYTTYQATTYAPPTGDSATTVATSAASGVASSATPATSGAAPPSGGSTTPSAIPANGTHVSIGAQTSSFASAGLVGLTAASNTVLYAGQTTFNYEFQLISLGNNQYVFKHLTKSAFIGVDNYGNSPLIVYAGTVSAWETFQLTNVVNQGVNYYYLLWPGNNNYVQVLSDNTLLASATTTAAATPFSFYPSY